MKDFGVISDFCKQQNYGGLLQAYAMVKAVEDRGYTCEQISFDKDSEQTLLIRFKVLVFKTLNLTFFKNIKNKIKLGKANKLIKVRQNAMDRFARDYIPSSKRVYKRRNIKACVPDYKGFIAGSDQIWSQTIKTYLLSFVPKECKKYSYAASIAREKLSEEQKELFKRYLPEFNAISVREEQSAAQLRELGIETQFVLDPTLLLSREDWDKICSDRLVKDNYIFCYFLGQNQKMNKAAEEFAAKRNLKIVNMPFLHKRYNDTDVCFGDIKLFDISPSDFISLIKYSDYVLTDSFHGSVFSFIYGKQFAVFERPPMNTRLECLLNTIGRKDRFVSINSSNVVDDINLLENIDYTVPNEGFEKALKFSENYLDTILIDGIS